ncbi:MAG: CPBP family intramembrane metalloprotease [Firmicutes bacterium]|jgi:membrane protease YdiL (CAAX protease family)|nr:CPBP family intramembrane metalloprotease [Bacillota bacterium]
MSAGTAAVTAIVVASATARALAWRRLGVSSIDIGDMLLVAMFAVALLGRCDPAVSFGIIGRLRWTAVAGSAALFLAGAAVGSGWRDRLWDKWRRWMERAGVNPGGAAIAVGLAPASWRMAAAAALTASGALLEEMLFRGFLLRWVRELVGFWWAVAAQAVAFGLVHAVPMARAGAPAPLVAYCMLMPAGIGLGLGALARWGLVYPWAVHWALNWWAAVRGGGREDNGK